MWIFSPAVGALIGWVTNMLAVRALFRPRKPVRIPILNRQYQGVLPSRQRDLARVIGETVERDLMSAEQLIRFVQENGYREEVVDGVTRYIEERLAAVLPRFVPESWSLSLRGYVGDIARREVDRLVAEMEVKLAERLRNDLPIGKLVEEKVLQLDLEELEAMVLRVASTELRYIEWMGAVLGGIIGLLQAAFLSIVSGAG